MGRPMSHPPCYTYRMIVKESIFQVTYKLTPKATILRKDFVKAFDVAHATRIANRLFRIVEKVEDLDMARWAADQS